MPRLAIIEPVNSAGGVERFIQGLILGAIEEGITREWEIVFLRKRFNSAGIHVPWPEQLSAPTIRIEYCLGPNNPLARGLERLASLRRVFNIRGSAFLIRKLTRALQSNGPLAWQALCGNTQVQIERYLRSHRFDVIYCSYPYGVSPPRTDRPLVGTIYDFIYKIYDPENQVSGRSSTSNMDEEIRKWLEVCFQVPVLSQATFDELRRLYPDYVHKALIIRHGVPSAFRALSEVDVEEFRRRSGLPEEFLLVAGWLIKHKNQKVVFEAVAKLRDRGIHIPVVCTGPNSNWLNQELLSETDRDWKNSYPSQIIEFCQSVGLRKGVDYFSLGYVGDSDIGCLFRLAKMLIVPSLAEGSCLPALEAISAKCPVVFSNIPPLREMMELTGNNAWSFNPTDSGELADVITEIILNEEAVKRRTAAAIEVAPRAYSWRQVAREYFSLFAKAAQSRP